MREGSNSKSPAQRAARLVPGICVALLKRKARGHLGAGLLWVGIAVLLRWLGVCSEEAPGGAAGEYATRALSVGHLDFGLLAQEAHVGHFWTRFASPVMMICPVGERVGARVFHRGAMRVKPLRAFDAPVALRGQHLFEAAVERVRRRKVRHNAFVEARGVPENEAPNMSPPKGSSTPLSRPTQIFSQYNTPPHFESVLH